MAAEYNAGIATVGAQYTSAKTGDALNSASGMATANETMKEAALYVSKDMGPLNATLGYINTDVGYDSNDAVLAMLTVKF